jgi:hypothetical protein
MISTQLEFRGRTGIAAFVFPVLLLLVFKRYGNLDQSENFSSYTGQVQFYQIRR